MKYLLDTNVFIEACKRYYAPSIVPSFWQFIRQDNDIYTLPEVIAEIEKQKDGLAAFIRDINIVVYSSLPCANTIAD